LLDNDGFFEDTLGPSGLRRADVHHLSPRLDGLRARLPAWRTDPASFLRLPFHGDIEALGARARAVAARCRNVIVLGIGGASLGGEMLVRILGGDPGYPAIHFCDNIDPAMPPPGDGVDWSESFVLAVSKSGDTAETLSRFLVLLPRLEERLGAGGLRDRILVVTENPRGALHELARRLGLEIMAHPAVPGRYSVLSVAGLLPAALGGVDIAALLQGARAMAEHCGEAGMEDNPAFWNGAAQYLHAERGRTQSVLMTYADRLRPFTHWWRQLWGESLGKRDAQGRARGLTPVEARGVTDQHSQLQLYLDGPDDKQFTFLAAPDTGAAGARLTERFADIPSLAPLAGRTLGELFQAEFEGTRVSLTRHGRPNRTLRLPPGDAAALGELIVLLEMETVVVAELLGVNPFDQPAVEEGKQLAREFLTKRSK
jgi:glucose-6-phosphate isomerase